MLKKGLNKLFIGSILIAVGGFVSGFNFNMACLVGYVFFIIGLIQAGKEHIQFKEAFMFVLFAAIASVVTDINNEAANICYEIPIWIAKSGVSISEESLTFMTSTLNISSIALAISILLAFFATLKVYFFMAIPDIAFSVIIGLIIVS